MRDCIWGVSLTVREVCRLAIAFWLIVFGISGVLRSEDFWQISSTGTNASLRGLSPIDRLTAWACGSQATLLRTVDGGQSWARLSIEGLDPKTELRSIHAWSAREAVVATAGSPCRIYRTGDYGKTWRCVYENSRSEAFIDALRFWDDTHGFAFGDPIDGNLMALASDDRGESWREAGVGYALRPSEAGFAASNSSMMLFGEGSVWIGLGGASGSSQILISDDRGANWRRDGVSSIRSGKSSGIFSLARSDSGRVVAVGGDYLQADHPTENLGVLGVEGMWEGPLDRGPGGYRSSVIWLAKPIEVESTGSRSIRWICAGPSGCDASEDARTWFELSKESFHALAIGVDSSVWACGGQGKVGLHVR